MLCLRRILLNESKALITKQVTSTEVKNCVELLINNHIGQLLLKSTEFARNAEMYQQAHLFILNAESYAPPTLFIEKAKLLWKKGDQASSLKVLERGIKELRISTPFTTNNTNEPLRKIYAQAKFLIANYNARSMNTNITMNMEYFKSSLQAFPESDKCLVNYAQYLEKVYSTMSPAEQVQPRGLSFQNEIMMCYGKSMMYGCKYIYQSMPRFLSIWLDFTKNETSNETYKKQAQRLNRNAEYFCEQLPPFMFFTAFSQLISRICHPSVEVYNILKTITIKLILEFPQQSLWMILCVYKSSYANRVRRCTEVFSDKRLADKAIQILISDFNRLAECMIELTNKTVAGATFSMSSSYNELPKLLKDSNFSNILMPTQRFMQPVLPGIGERDKPAGTFNAFPHEFVYIRGVQEKVVVMPSLQKPKRITLQGSDGKCYMIMMKAKDDLRKDFRLMEFNAIVNRYLHHDPEARQRRLYIRTYAVLPLNEECGILEWVSNLQPLRNIIVGRQD